MIELSRQSDLPLYKQICESVKEKVETGQLRNGDKIASEYELANQYCVSRMTVRQAINELIRERVLVRKRGNGTFVAEKNVQRVFKPGIVTGFFEDFSDSGIPLLSKVVENSIVNAPKKIAEAMGIPENSQVCKLTRLRTIDGQPIVLDESYLDISLWPDIKDKDFMAVSLFRHINNIVGVPPKSSEVSIHSASASQDVARLLQLVTGSPILIALMINKFNDKRVLQVGCLYCPEFLDIKFTLGE
jgi:GntR family transcriptional regulator